ncbi:hypothetical protein HDU98_000648 [Podochytrium sp. JEL0797]|nr:hypothetical protein HDU98_000648 [Podochytrium sp. JEL0797]
MVPTTSAPTRTFADISSCYAVNLPSASLSKFAMQAPEDILYTVAMCNSYCSSSSVPNVNYSAMVQDDTSALCYCLIAFDVSTSVPTASCSPMNGTIESISVLPVVLYKRDSTQTTNPPPRLVIYANQVNPGLPDMKYNIVNFNFWPADFVTATIDPKPYQAAGQKVLISAYGQGSTPATSGNSAINDALQLSKFVIANGLDGVDIDFEDGDSFKAGGGGEQWLITLTQQLRALLPSPRYIISHAPQAPHFSPGFYPNGAYLAVDKAVGHLIDFYNVQFYNQGESSYDTCTTLLTKSSGWALQTSVFEIAAQGVALDKIVIGKPLTPTNLAPSATGYMHAADLQNCLVQANGMGWGAGAMGWKLGDGGDGSWVDSLSQAFKVDVVTPGGRSMNATLVASQTGRAGVASNGGGNLDAIRTASASESNGAAVTLIEGSNWGLFLLIGFLL